MGHHRRPRRRRTPEEQLIIRASVSSRMSQYSSYSVTNGVATIELSRPDKYNALTIGMWEDIAEFLHRAEANDVRVAILTGKGDMFCAGDDIETLASIADERGVRELSRAIYECFHAIETVSIPVIGKANGDAYGGGFELLMACDLTVVPQNATFALPEVQIGAYPLYGVKRLGRLIGRQRAMELAATGREISASQAFEWGLFARVVPTAEIDEVVEDWIEQLKQGSPAALEITKAWLTRSLQLPGEDVGMQTGLGYLYAGSDPVEGAEAFLSDQDPDFAE